MWLRGALIITPMCERDQLPGNALELRERCDGYAVFGANEGP